ncbi:PAF acetylhydrolase [Hortaea werneckii]|uniref:Putative phospholipase n=1 Tax=Hortaea werneckii TaxID=91943 RepID=A0A3M7CMI2_HORWE|nr:PAF acetylhydrolase [Hortaea werneckii]RMY53243.1 hypothetical protein D0865_05354 [Hortaea werneckii]
MFRTPAILRPRWTIRYVLCSIAVLYFSYCTLFDMPLFSSALPEYTGPYEVGTIDLEVPCDGRKVNDAVFKDSGKPAFEMQTVFFSLYYPAVKDYVSSKPHHLWIPKPIALHGEGYARFAHINNFFFNNIFTFGLWALAGSTSIPAKVDVPLHGTVKYGNYETEHPLDEYGLPMFPVIVFSHGMASSRTGYTQYAAELASRGYIVAAIEHRDGSGPGSLIMYPDGTTKEWMHFDAQDLDPQPETAEIKAMQLAMRQAEVEETVRVLREINDGAGSELFKSNPRQEGTDLAEWRGRLNMDFMVVGGHSYGATLALQTLKGAPCEERPFKGAVILDPGKQSGPLNDDISIPTLIVHSDSWSKKHTIFHGRPHFEVVKELVQKVLDQKNRFAWFMTSKGTTHPSITDAPLIEPTLLSWTTGATIPVREGVEQYVKVTDEFMRFLEDGHRRGILAEEVTHPEYDHDIRSDERKKGMSKEIEKYWQIHVAPKTNCPYPGLCGVDPE